MIPLQVVLPGFTPVTLPSDETDAIDGSADDQDSVLFLASFGLILAVIEV